MWHPFARFRHGFLAHSRGTVFACDLEFKFHNGFGLVTVWTPCNMFALGSMGERWQQCMACHAMPCHKCFVSCHAKTNILGTLQNMFIIVDHVGKRFLDVQFRNVSSDVGRCVHPLSVTKLFSIGTVWHPFARFCHCFTALSRGINSSCHLEFQFNNGFGLRFAVVTLWTPCDKLAPVGHEGLKLFSPHCISYIVKRSIRNIPCNRCTVLTYHILSHL